MKILKFFTLLILVLISAAANAQIKFNEISDIKNTFFQYYLGKDNGKTIFLVSNNDLMNQYAKYTMYNSIEIKGKQWVQLLEYDDVAKAPNVIELKLKHDIFTLTSAVLNKGRVEVMYDTKWQNGFHKEVFDLGGKMISEGVAIEKEDKGLLAKLPQLYGSDNGLCFLYKQGTSYKMVDKNNKTTWHSEIEHLSGGFNVLNDGSLITSRKDSKTETEYLVKYNPKGKKTEIKLPADADFKVDETRGSIYILSFDAASSKSEESGARLTFGIYNIADLQQVKEYKTRLKQESGLEGGLVLQNVIFPAAGKDPILVLQDFRLESYTATNTQGQAIRTTYTYKYGAIQAVAFTGENSSDQASVSRRIAFSSELAVNGSLLSVYHKNKLYLVFNNAGDYSSSKYKLEVHILDGKMTEVSKNEYDTHKDQEIYFQPRSAVPVDDNNYLIPGSWKKKCGTAFLTMD